MKKIFLSGFVAIAALGLGCYIKPSATGSALLLANVEALSNYELPDVVITCSSGNSGQCFQENFTRWVMEGERMYHPCRYTGNERDYCS